MSIMAVYRCVKCGDIRGVIFLITLIFMMSLPTALDGFSFLIMLVISLTDGGGKTNLFLFCGIRNFKICKGVVKLFLGNLEQIKLILFM